MSAKPWRQRLQGHRQNVAHVALGDLLREQVVHPEGQGRRDDLGDEAGMRPGRVQHLPRLRRRRRHAGLAEHMLARLQRGEGQRAVHIGPGADADRLYGRVFQQLAPTVVDGGDVELVGHDPPRLAGAVGHRHNLDAVNLVEAGDVPVAGIAARADQPDSDAFVCHGYSPFL